MTKSATTIAAARAGAVALALALPVALTVTLAGLAAPAHAEKVVKPRGGSAGTWKLIGQTHADHPVDHDTISAWARDEWQIVAHGEESKGSAIAEDWHPQGPALSTKHRNVRTIQ